MEKLSISYPSLTEIVSSIYHHPEEGLVDKDTHNILYGDTIAQQLGKMGISIKYYTRNEIPITLLEIPENTFTPVFQQLEGVHLEIRSLEGPLRLMHYDPRGRNWLRYRNVTLEDPNSSDLTLSQHINPGDSFALGNVKRNNAKVVLAGSFLGSVDQKVVGEELKNISRTFFSQYSDLNSQ